MSLLGDWVARIIIDHSGVAKALSASERRWDEYYKFIEKRDAEQSVIVKKSLESVGKFGATTRSELKKQFEGLTATQKKTVDSTVRELSRAEAAYNRQIKLVSDLRTRMLQYASVAITIPVTFLAKKAIEDFAEFQQAMQNIRAVIGATESDMVLLTDAAIQMSTKFSTSPTLIAKAMFELGQAGLDAIEIYQEIGPVLQLSAAGMKDVAFTANLVTTTLQAFQLESDQASKVADIFSSSNAKSVSSLDKLNASLKYTAGLWSSMGWTLEDLVGTLDTLYDTGVRGEKAGRLLASAINGLQKPSVSAQKAISRLLGYSEALSPAFNDITKIIEKLSSANADASDIVKIFGKESAEVINRLVQNYSVLGENIAEVSNQTGETAKQAATQLDTLGKRADTLRIVFGNISKETVGVFAPSMKDVVNSLISLGNVISKLPSGIKAFIASFTLITAASPVVILAFTKIAAAMAVTNAAGIALGTTIAAAMGPIAIVAAGLGALTAYYAVSRKYQEDWEKSVVSSVSELSRQGKSIDSITRSLNDLYQSGINTSALRDGLEQLAEVFPRLRDQLNKNAGDTASAMRVLNEEYARLKSTQSNISKNTSLGESASKLDESILKSKQRISELDEELAYLKSRNYFSDIQRGLKDIGKGDLSKTFEELAFNLRSGAISVNDMGNAIGNDMLSGQRWKFLQDVKELSSEAQDARLNLIRLTSGKYNVEIGNVDKDLTTLEKMVDIFDSIENSVIATKFKLLMDDKSVEESAKEIAKSISDAIGNSLSGVVVGDQLDMQKIGILPKEGEITSFYKEEYDNMFSRIKEEMAKNGAGWWDTFKSSFGSESEALDFSGSFDKLKKDISDIQGLQIEITQLQESGDKKNISLIQEKQKKLQGLQDKYKNLWNTQESQLTAEEKALRNSILFAGVMENSIDQIIGKQKESLDWWEKIISESESMIKVLNGIDSKDESITSLNEKLKELRSGIGEAPEKLRELAKSIRDALSSSPEFSGMDNVIEVEAIFRQLENSVIEVYDNILSKMGISLPVQSFTIARDRAMGLVKILEALRGKTDKNTESYRLYSEAIDKTNASLLELEGSSGAISDLEFKSKKFIVDFKNRKKSVSDLQEAFNSFDPSNFSEAMYIIENIDPEKGLPELSDNLKENSFESVSKALKQISQAQDHVNKEMQDAKRDFDWGIIGSEEYEERLKKLRIILDVLSKKKDISIGINIDNITNMSDSIGNVASDIDSMIDTFNDADARISDVTKSIGNSISSIGSAISLISGPVGQIVSLVGSLLSTIGSIFRIFEKDSASSSDVFVSEFANAIEDAAYEAKEAMAETYRGVGESLGKLVNSGFADGLMLSDAELINSFKKYMFNMISTALITASGFESQIADIAQSLWGKLSPGSAQIAKFQKELDSLYSNIIPAEQVDNAKQALSEYYAVTESARPGNLNDLIKWSVSLKKTSDYLSSILGKTIVGGDFEAISAAITRIEELNSAISSTSTAINSSADISSELGQTNSAISEYAEIIASLADSLGISSINIEDATKEIQDSLVSSLSEAVLTGSYVDFKNAVYKKITESIIDAAISSSAISGRISSLINSIMDTRLGFDSNDANAILGEVRNIWNEFTNENTPLGSIMMGLRDALGEFGLLDINVNPGTVVTAIPSDVRDDLIQAIESSIDLLVDAITTAGLNSNINTVNITTAYITSMTASTIAIQQANLNLNGSMVFQMQNGASFSEWLETWMTDYLARSAP